jgi:hypothetical protein
MASSRGVPALGRASIETELLRDRPEVGILGRMPTVRRSHASIG